MSERRLYLDEGYGETRGVVALDGRPERLLIARDGDTAAKLGARYVALVRRIDRASALAFLDLGSEEAVLNLGGDTQALTEGAAADVEVRTEARRGKLATVRWAGPSDGEPRLMEAAPSLETRLQAYAPQATVQTGGSARAMADGAEEEALSALHALPGGGVLAIEVTRALTALDVDLGDRPGADAKRASRAANFAAIAQGARLLRLKGLGGLICIDLVGRGHDGAAMLSAARQAFAADNPGVAIAPVSRFGVMELTVPRRARAALEVLTDETGEPTPLTRALALVRSLEREARADPGGRFEALAGPAVADAAGPVVGALARVVGARVSVRCEAARADADTEVRRT